MLTFLISNAGTIVTALVLAAVVFFVVRGMVRDRKAGRGGCGADVERAVPAAEDVPYRL